MLDLIDRLEKDARGSLVVILILGIIEKHENTWGYQIKQKLLKITDNKIQINDSTLYTILRSLEKQYNLVNSAKIERKRTYTLSKHGKEQFKSIIKFWSVLTEWSKIFFENLGIDLDNTEDNSG